MIFIVKIFKYLKVEKMVYLRANFAVKPKSKYITHRLTWTAVEKKGVNGGGGGVEGSVGLTAGNVRNWKCQEAGRSEIHLGSIHPLPIPQAWP